MSKKVTYTCDICRDPITERIFGLHFTDLHRFKVSKPDSTDGVHVCYQCWDQLADQFPKSEAVSV